MQDSHRQDQQSEKHRHDYRRHDPVGQAELGHGRSLLFGGSVSLPSVTGRCRAKDGDAQSYAGTAAIASGKSAKCPSRTVQHHREKEMAIRAEREAIGRLWLD
jgi:hypothetical protein